jgi:hypothetical protein
MGRGRQFSDRAELGKAIVGQPPSLGVDLEGENT